MKRGVVVLLGLLACGVFASSAFATDPAPVPSGTGYIELCKAANTALNGTFAFSVTDSATTQSASLAQGTCTQPIAVKPGSVTVKELGGSLGLNDSGTTVQATEYLSATETAVGSAGPLPSGTGFTYVVNVPASPVGAGSAGVVTVTYSDTVITGTVEVCKAIVAGSGLTGNWTFTLWGANGYTSTVSVPAGSCSAPITVPAGHIVAQETGDNGAENVTNITAVNGAGTPSQLTWSDNPTAKAVARVAVGDATQGTIITMTNDSVRLKLCKYVDGGLTNTGPYKFSLSSTGNSGPTAVPATVTLSAGTSAPTAVCTVVGTFRAGTVVTIAESPSVGSKVGSISTNPTTNVGGSATVATAANLQNGTISVLLGAGETVVTYEDIPAKVGTLKVCKAIGPSTPAIVVGTLFSFTVTPTAGTPGSPVTVMVPAGSCADLGANFPYMGTYTVSEAAVTNTTVTGITSDPTPWVQVWEAGVLTNTNVASLPSMSLSGRTANVTISEAETTEVTFTNIDPLPGAPASGGGSSSSGGGSSSSGGGGGSSSSGGGSSSSSSSPSTGTTSVVAATGTGLTLPAVVTTKTVAAGAAIAKALKLSMLNKQLKTLKAQAKLVLAKEHAAKTHVAKLRFATQLASIQKHEVKLVLQIRQLKK